MNVEHSTYLYVFKLYSFCVSLWGWVGILAWSSSSPIHSSAKINLSVVLSFYAVIVSIPSIFSWFFTTSGFCFMFPVLSFFFLRILRVLILNSCPDWSINSIIQFVVVFTYIYSFSEISLLSPVSSSLRSALLAGHIFVKGLKHPHLCPFGEIFSPRERRHAFLWRTRALSAMALLFLKELSLSSVILWQWGKKKTLRKFPC